MTADASLHFFVYCDASFDKRRGIGAVSLLVFNTPKDHEAGDRSLGKTETKIIRETSSIRVELHSVLHALETVRQTASSRTSSDDTRVVHLYTDCRAVTELPLRRERLVRSGYVSKRSGEPLRNADLYRAFFAAQEKMDLILHWIKGHRPTTGKTMVEQNFAHVDKVSRKALRKCLMALNGEGKPAKDE